jgi:hypothetical protein
MRKLYWCAAAMAVLGAVAICVITGYVHCCPNSLLGGCASAALRVGVAVNPVIGLGTSLRVAVPQEDTEADVEVAPCPPSEPGLMSDPCPERLQPVPAAEDCEACEPLLPQTAPPQIGEGPEGSVILPWAPSEAGLRATDDFFCPMPPGNTEASEPPTIADPQQAEEVKSGHPPACREDCKGTDHYPACPHLGSCCPFSGKCAPQGGAEECAEPELLPPPHPASPAHKDSPKSTSWKTSPSSCPSPCLKSPAVPGVDTLEFRPSDAKKGEFDPIWY